MKKILTGLVLMFFVFTSQSVQALSDADSKKLEDAGKKIKDLAEKYQKKKLEKYNEVDISLKDTDGNPRDCTVRLYYNDYKQERFSTSGGTFNSVFNHGESMPTELYSVAVYDCPCYPIKIDVNGPSYPGLSEEIEKIKEVILDEVEGEATKKITKEVKDKMEKAMAKVFDGMGHSGATWAKRFMSGVGVGMDLGKPFKDFFDKEIAKLFDAFLEQDKRRDELLDEKEPKNSNRSIVKEEWSDYLARKASGSAFHEATTKYDIDVLLRCPKNHKPKEFLLDWKWVDRLPPITKPEPKITPPPVHTGEAQETEAEYAERVRQHNQRIAREAQAREEAAARRAQQEAEAKAKAEAAAKAKAERINKECKKCDQLKQALETKRAEVEAAWDNVSAATTRANDAHNAAAKAKRAQARAEAKRDNFNKPGTDYVESNGRRIDATDLELRDAAAQLGWERYQAGELTAQEVSDYWQSLDADAIDALRAKVKADLEAAAKAAKAAKEKADQAANDADADRKTAVDDLNKKSGEADKIESAYKDCLKKCQDDKKVNILQDYGIAVTQKKPAFSWLPWNWGVEPVTLLEFHIPEKVAAIPDLTMVDYPLLFDADGDGPADLDDAVEVPDPPEATKTVWPFHSVMDEISAGPMVVNQHNIGQSGRLINVAAPKSLNESVPADGTQTGSGTGGFGAALQILLDDGTVDIDDQLGITFSGSGMELYEGPATTDPTGVDDETFTPDYNALSDLPDATNVPPSRNPGGASPSTNFVLKFSEPMDRATVEDNFIVRSFAPETLTVDDEAAFAQQTEDQYAGKIWDDSHFDVDWNSDDTEATFTFKEERALDPPPKKKVIIIIIIDRRAQQAGLVSTPLDYFNLPDGALNPAFDNAPPLGDPIFADGFESGDTTAWGSTLPHGAGLGTRASGGQINEPNLIAVPANPVVVPDPPTPSCAPGEYADAQCGYSCQASQRCTNGSQPDCFTCEDVCQAGYYTSTTCGGDCQSNQVCLPISPAKQCFECVVVPTDLSIGEPPEEKETIKIGEDPIACTPECSGKTCGDDGCGGSCGSCASGENCTSAGQCEGPTPISCNPNFYEQSGTCQACPAGCTSPLGSTSVDDCSCPVIPACHSHKGQYDDATCLNACGSQKECVQLPGADCFSCEAKAAPACEPDCHGRTCGDDGCGGSCGSCASGESCDSFGQCEADAPSCPLGSIADEDSCNSQCSNGACNDNGGGCYSCLQCDSGSFSTQAACEADGSNCEIGGSQGNLSCWIPKASCEDLCSQNGLSADPIDFTSEVENQLNAQTCVSSYSMQIVQGTVGECSCYSTQAPTITFDTTPPVCAGTVCGDVTCNQSITCDTGENQTTTVTCNWGGWQKETQYQYRPLLGGN